MKRIQRSLEEELGTTQYKYMRDSYYLQARTTTPPDTAIELARVELEAGATAIFDVADPNNPGVNEIDLRYRKYTGKEVVNLQELSDVSKEEADAFNTMNNPSASNPVATIQDVDNRVDPVKDEVETARGDRSSLDSRLDVMLKEDGTFKGITSINPQPPLSGGGTSGTVQIGIAPATPTEAGSMSAADKAKLNEIEVGATADMTGEEIVNLIESSELLTLSKGAPGSKDQPQLYSQPQWKRFDPISEASQ
ncbi:MAG: hypothetical protein QME81_06995 [bacterium]|nr:hypothetical protein [bacterium]